MDDLREIHNQPDPLLRFQMASVAIERCRVSMSRLKTIRAQALLELRQGHSVAAVAQTIGVTRQQVHRLLRETIGREYQPADD